VLLLHPSLVGTFAGGAVTLLGLPFRVLGRGTYHSHGTSVLVAPLAAWRSAVAMTPTVGAVAVLAETALDVDAMVALHASGVDEVIELTDIQLVRARLAALVRLVSRRGASAPDLPARPTIEVNGKRVEMPRLCRRVYRLLERSAGKPVTLEQILIAMDTPEASINNAVQMIARLRVFLGPEGARIRTLRKRGYVFEA
jgi:DNA-binding response OmpR family regulator